MVTLRDVADAAGVSEATASAVLAGRALTRRIAGATAERVRASAQRLGYRGNASARALARGTSGAIAYAVADTSIECLSSAYTSLTAAGVISRAHALGYGALIAGPRQGRDQDYLEAALASIAEHRCDGVIVAGPLLKERDIELLARSREAPVVIIDPPAGLDLPAVRIDWRPGIDAALAALAAAGHRHLRYVGPRDAREELVSAACAALGLGCSAMRERELLGGTTVTLRAALGEGRCAIVAYNDLLAIRLARAAAAGGLRIPQDLSLVGFDEVESRHAVPRLASIDHRFCDLGAAAVDLLLERLAAGPGHRGERTLPATFSVGASIA